MSQAPKANFYFDPSWLIFYHHDDCFLFGRDLLGSHSLKRTVGKRNYFTRKVTYFTRIIACGQITMKIVTDIEMYSHRQEAREVGFRSPWSNSAYPQWNIIKCHFIFLLSHALSRKLMEYLSWLFILSFHTCPCMSLLLRVCYATCDFSLVDLV